MTFHQKIGTWIFAALAVALLAGGYIIFQYLGVSASEVADRGDAKGQVTLSDDFNSDGKKESVMITSYQKNGQMSSFISSKDHFLRYRESALTGFEEDLAYCPIKTFDIGGDKAICIFGEVGAHAQNIQIVRWRDFAKVLFIDKSGISSPNIISDVPNFDFVYPAAEKLTIYLDNRNYDKNPLVDIIRTYYYLGNNAFRFDKEEELSSEGLIK